VTLELTPKEVEMIVFATQKGRLVLSLRSYNETGFEDKLQSVNFKYLQDHIEEYNKERRRLQGLQ
jgi:pilus assembly protein CpaB